MFVSKDLLAFVTYMIGRDFDYLPDLTTPKPYLIDHAFCCGRTCGIYTCASNWILKSSSCWTVILNVWAKTFCFSPLQCRAPKDHLQMTLSAISKVASTFCFTLPLPNWVSDCFTFLYGLFVVNLDYN